PQALLDAIDTLATPPDAIEADTPGELRRKKLFAFIGELVKWENTTNEKVIGKARELAGMSLWEFRQLLASRRISPHYDEMDLSEDVATLREMRRL
ncbi:MAG: UPF0175 family protein, partial [Anaerolineales bacterium]|nr:UPF0175 family protein [Anaerolineales bacterium]